MPSFSYQTVDVFTERRFGGNPLAVFTDARGMGDADMQALAAEMNYSETTFVLPPSDPAHTARVRIFHRKAEMPFAGHPNVGTAFVLGRLGRGGGADVLRFEQIAGLVEVELQRDAAGDVTGATIAAPRPLSTAFELPAERIAACLGLSPDDLVLSRHRPLQASVGVDFVLAEVTSEGLARACPDVAAYRTTEAAHPELGGRLSVFAYTRDGEAVRARMFAPLAGTFEDPATGSAGAALAALRLSLDGGDRLSFTLTQGVEMGRPSLLRLTARRTPDGIVATVGGSCIPVFRGEALL